MQELCKYKLISYKVKIYAVITVRSNKIFNERRIFCVEERATEKAFRRASSPIIMGSPSVDNCELKISAGPDRCALWALRESPGTIFMLNMFPEEARTEYG